MSNIENPTDCLSFCRIFQCIAQRQCGRNRYALLRNAVSAMIYVLKYVDGEMMSDIFELKDIVWFLMGWLIPEICQKIIHFFSERNIERLIKKENDRYIRNGNNICPLSHGTPFFANTNLTVSAPNEQFYFSMPEQIHTAISSKNPDFEHTNWEKPCIYWKNEDESNLLLSIERITNDISREEIRELIENKKKEIAEMFLSKCSQAFFNGEKYGIKEIKDRRVGNEEKAKIVITSIRTDYYTHRVMAAVYQELLKTGKLTSPDGLENINDYYPFLTSMGMNVLLVIENRKKVVLTKRSKRLINMEEDQWHLSMNEGISITDLLIDGIDLEGCVRRGLKEELGLDYNNFVRFSLYYSDIFFLKNPLEVGILAIVLIDDLTESMVRESYNIAQDAPLESTGNDETGLTFLPLSKSKIGRFCEGNNITDAAKYALKMLCIRMEGL